MAEAFASHHEQEAETLETCQESPGQASENAIADDFQERARQLDDLKSRIEAFGARIESIQGKSSRRLASLLMAGSLFVSGMLGGKAEANAAPDTSPAGKEASFGREQVRDATRELIEATAYKDNRGKALAEAFGKLRQQEAVVRRLFEAQKKRFDPARFAADNAASFLKQYRQSLVRLENPDAPEVDEEERERQRQELDRQIKELGGTPETELDRTLAELEAAMKEKLAKQVLGQLFLAVQQDVTAFYKVDPHDSQMLKVVIREDRKLGSYRESLRTSHPELAGLISGVRRQNPALEKAMTLSQRELLDYVAPR